MDAGDSKSPASVRLSGLCTSRSIRLFSRAISVLRWTTSLRRPAAETSLRIWLMRGGPGQAGAHTDIADAP